MKYILKYKFIVGLLWLTTFQPAQSFTVPSFIKTLAAKVKSYFVKPNNNSANTDKSLIQESAVSPAQILDDIKKNNHKIINKQQKKQSAFINHLRLMQEIKERFNALRRIAPSDSLDSHKAFTQTEAYLNVYIEGVEESFGEDTLKVHQELIDTIITKEKELSMTHFFFYHAHDRSFMILHDFIKILDKYLRLLDANNNFIPLRYKAIHTIGCNNVNEYLATHASIHDHNEETRSHMTSVNVALFGNHNNSGECTFRYFLDNMSIASYLFDRLKPLFDYYNFNEKYIEKLTALTSYLESSTGSLLQICIPKEKVNDLVYLSHSFGRPYGKVESITMNDSQTPIDVALEHMRVNPEKIYDLKEWQARLMFFDPMLNMDPTIKIFRYHTVPDENIALYQKKLENIVIQILTDYLIHDPSRMITTPRNEPLFKLYGYMQQHI